MGDWPNYVVVPGGAGKVRAHSGENDNDFKWLGYRETIMCASSFVYRRCPSSQVKIITDGVKNFLSVAKCRVSSTSVFLLSFFSAVQTSSWVSSLFFCTKFNSKAILQQVMAVFSCSVWNN